MTEPMNFDDWLEHPYTMVLQKSVAEDYTPRHERVEMTDEQLRAEFAKSYPNDDSLLHLAENNRDYWLEAVAARHRLRAFMLGARAVSSHHAKE